jgi:hypothetical protein
MQASPPWIIIPQRKTAKAVFYLKQNADAFCCGSMFSQPSEIFDFRSRREVIIPQRGSREVASPLEQNVDVFCHDSMPLGYKADSPR